MADTYISETNVKARLGTGVHDALAALTGVSITQLREDATAVIQSALRNSGYATPSTTTDVVVMLATFGVFLELACAIPEASIALPEQWTANEYYRARKDIVSGVVELTGHSRSIAGSVGGIVASDPDDTIADGGRPPVATRANLVGY